MITGVIIERFWAKVDRLGDDDCWPFLGSTNEHGYGTFWEGDRRWKAHRFAWYLATGQEPSAHVLHHCDNPPCVNVRHLFSGTQSDNMFDMYAKGRKVPIGLPGAANGNAKLTALDVCNIRTRFTAGGESISALSRAFGVSRTHIRRIGNRESWA